MGPDLQPDVNVWELLAYGALNPATIAAAFYVGRQANEKSKILIAAFAGAVAGAALLYILTLLRIWDAPMLGRASGGVIVSGLVAGLVYGWIGYATRK